MPRKTPSPVGDAEFDDTVAAVSLSISGPVPFGLAPDAEIWGYIVGYDAATRRLEVAPKRCPPHPGPPPFNVVITLR